MAKKRLTAKQAWNRMRIKDGSTTINKEVEGWFRVHSSYLFRKMAGDDFGSTDKAKNKFEKWCNENGYNQTVAKRTLVRQVADLVDYCIGGPKTKASWRRITKSLYKIKRMQMTKKTLPKP